MLKTKKIIGAVMAGVLALTSFSGVVPNVALDLGTSVGVSAEVSTATSGTCGENLTWELDSEGTLTISGSGEMENYHYDYYTNSYDSPFYDRSDIKKVIICDGVTSIGYAAFYYCTSLESVTIPDSVTSIGDNAFYYCTSLESVTIPDSVTSIDVFAFSSCSSLKSITIPDSVTSIGYGSFSSCSSLKSITIKNPECKISDITSTICNGYDYDKGNCYFDGTVYGYANSTAQAYAEKYGYNFEALDEDPDSTTAVPGDANGDDVLNVRDAAYIAKKAAQGKASELPLSADFNGDGKVNIRDAAAIAKHLVTHH